MASTKAVVNTAPQGHPEDAVYTKERPCLFSEFSSSPSAYQAQTFRLFAHGSHVMASHAHLEDGSLRSHRV